MYSTRLANIQRTEGHIYMVGYCTEYRGTCLWLDNAQAAEVHVQYMVSTMQCTEVQYIYVVGYYTRYRGICTWLDTGQAEEVHVQYTAGYIYRYMVR
jgi:hypothetical protein